MDGLYNVNIVEIIHFYVLYIANFKLDYQTSTSEHFGIWSMWLSRFLIQIWTEQKSPYVIVGALYMMFHENELKLVNKQVLLGAISFIFLLYHVSWFTAIMYGKEYCPKGYQCFGGAHHSMVSSVDDVFASQYLVLLVKVLCPCCCRCQDNKCY